MIKNDHQLGKPFVQYVDTQANIEALTGLDEGSTAYATDTDQLGAYDGAAWVWYSTTKQVLMADGITPPDPLTTEDETDWLYEG